MTSNSQTSPTAPWSKAWSAAVREPATEFDLTELPVLAGEIPPDLQGSLYQNGAGRLERGGQRAGHWFDGDGAILAVHFESGRAQACYQYVKTAGYLAEERAERYLKKSYGMLAAGPWPLRMLSDFKNAANTSVLPLDDRLLALWEGGQPHGLDLQTLETQGLDNLDGGLQGSETYSAHPKIDPVSGDIFNFGVQAGPITWLNLYRSDRTGKILQRNRLRLNGVPLIHDMVLAGPYLVFCVPPVRLNLAPALLNLKSFSESLAWKPELGTEIIVIDRQTLQQVSQTKAPAWFQWHFSNGFLDLSSGQSPEIVIDLVRYPDFTTHEYLRTVASGYVTAEGGGQLWRLRIDPQTAALLSEECLWAEPCEFPMVEPAQVGQNAQVAYFVTYPPGTSKAGELMGAIARLDLSSKVIDYTRLKSSCYPSAPMYGGKQVFSVVFDGEQQQTQLWIFARDSLAQPQCILQLPQVIPFGFHGYWSNRP